MFFNLYEYQVGYITFVKQIAGKDPKVFRSQLLDALAKYVISFRLKRRQFVRATDDSYAQAIWLNSLGSVPISAIKN